MVQLLVDNDVLIKAAHWGLLDHIPACAGTTWKHVAVLDSLIYRVKKRDKKLFLNPAVAEALEKRLQETSPLPVPDSTTLTALQGTTGLDAGEVVLIACVVATKGSFLVTGDKRALRTLGSAELANIAKSLEGRVICLEHIIRNALDALGPVELARTIEPYRELDTAVRVIVPAVDNAKGAGQRIQEALNAYLGELNGKTNGMLKIQ